MALYLGKAMSHLSSELQTKLQNERQSAGIKWDFEIAFPCIVVVGKSIYLA